MRNPPANSGVDQSSCTVPAGPGRQRARTGAVALSHSLFTRSLAGRRMRSARCRIQRDLSAGPNSARPMPRTDLSPRVIPAAADPARGVQRFYDKLRQAKGKRRLWPADPPCPRRASPAEHANSYSQLCASPATWPRGLVWHAHLRSGRNRQPRITPRPVQEHDTNQPIPVGGPQPLAALGGTNDVSSRKAGAHALRLGAGMFE